MNAFQLLESLGLAHLVDAVSDEDAAKLEREIEVHYQPNYPLMGTIENAKMSKGKIVLALGAGGGYGDSTAWDEEEETDLDTSDARELAISKVMRAVDCERWVAEALFSENPPSQGTAAVLASFGYDCSVEDNSDFWNACDVSQELFDAAMGY